MIAIISVHCSDGKNNSADKKVANDTSSEKSDVVKDYTMH